MALALFVDILRKKQHTIMAQFQSQDLPQLLIIHPPAFFTHFQSELSKKFHILHAGESPLPLDQYLTPMQVQSKPCFATMPLRSMRTSSGCYRH